MEMNILGVAGGFVWISGHILPGGSPGRSSPTSQAEGAFAGRHWCYRSATLGSHHGPLGLKLFRLPTTR